MPIDANRVLQIIGVIIVALQGYTASQIPGIESEQKAFSQRQEEYVKEVLVELNQHQAELLAKILDTQTSITAKISHDIEEIDGQIKDYRSKHP